MRIGVLALQGDFEAHARVLRALHADVVEVRRTAALAGLDGLVMPGGESTTLLNLMEDEPWFDALRELHRAGAALFGTCAGAILLAREVRGPSQPSLGLLDVAIERNSYGRQVDSFEARVVTTPAIGEPVDAMFIRAPRSRELGARVEVLGTLGDEPVLVRQGNVLAGTFHPELTASSAVHRFFLAGVRTTRVASGRPRAARAAGGSGSRRATVRNAASVRTGG